MYAFCDWGSAFAFGFIALVSFLVVVHTWYHHRCCRLVQRGSSLLVRRWLIAVCSSSVYHRFMIGSTLAYCGLSLGHRWVIVGFVESVVRVGAGSSLNQ
jgi:hypothetical protein